MKKLLLLLLTTAACRVNEANAAIVSTTGGGDFIIGADIWPLNSSQPVTRVSKTIHIINAA